MLRINKLSNNPIPRKSDAEIIYDLNNKVNEIIDIILDLAKEIETLKKQRK
jgi:hypothetical protein